MARVVHLCGSQHILCDERHFYSINKKEKCVLENMILNNFSYLYIIYNFIKYDQRTILVTKMYINTVFLHYNYKLIQYLNNR